MSKFILSEELDRSKVFIVKHSNLEKRLDPFYYIPKISELEEKVQEHNPKPLRDYVQSVSSGATPKTTESEKYYSTKENGIPFLRVQNLSPTGQLHLDDCKYINKATHESHLKRSQVSEGDLLVKITGVGRMAVASVAPEGFIGNTNQHMVVIKTGNIEISKVLAAFLNSDIGEKLASRRATGGTRPALDYSALMSIPIIYDEKILEITKKAVKQKGEKEQQAQSLLGSINDYLLRELGITLPEKDNSLQNRIFTTTLSKVSGGRFDPIFFSKQINFLFQSKFDYRKIKDLAHSFRSGFGMGKNDQNLDKKGVVQVRPTNMMSHGVLSFHRNIYAPATFLDQYPTLKKGDILFNNTNSQALVGKTAMWENNLDQAFYSNHITVIKVKNELVDPGYLKCVLNLYQSHRYFYSICTNWNNQSGVGIEQLKTIKIPLPDLSIQKIISKRINQLYKESSILKKNGAEEMAKAQKEIESIIING
ncbi:restriction endonuclease subunit S [Xanthovirga aplysinae]|uniref:restriction endonuclease subunit S n=1 Tax=Xanthovirga aplysinae TaxID=2529853 RepID=UPI0012BBE5F4|nr:restriction endonuclease subunit S [Xanthovirga aplysinae]MTI31096.1 hypothetical protein [Xanthovirga aplysinae]